MRCTILASGSKGNCTIVEGQGGAILIDAGLSAKETMERLSETSCAADSIGAILVTHEHGDHIKGLDVLARKLSIPIYATGGTLNDFLCHRRTSTKPLVTHTCRYHESFTISDFTITPFATSHDAAEPCGFIVRENGARLGYCTDTGILSPQMVSLLKDCEGVVLESNHCPDMLKNGPYPESLKRRIRSSRGHLSNPAASDGLRTLCKEGAQVILAHLSEINNTPDRARASARDALGLFYEEKMLTIATQEGSSHKSPQRINL